MFDWLRKRLKVVKEHTPRVNRNINDITISTKEGLSGTREIIITAWTPEMTLQFYREVRNELRENP